MSAYDYCRDKVALPGSSLYYSVLYAPRGLRESLVALHAAAEEFREVAEEISDEGIARTKLGWWADEMQRAAAGEPRHPITRVLSASMRGERLDAGRFVAVLSAFAEHQRRDAYETFADLETHCERIADLTGCMAAELCGFADPVTLEVSRHLGVGLTLAEIIRRPRRRGAHRRTDLPNDLLAKCEAADLDAEHTSEALREVLRSVAEAARRHLQRTLDEMPHRDRATQCNRLALAEMTLAQLRAIERAEYAVLERTPAATPLRKLWIAWKYRG